MQPSFSRPSADPAFTEQLKPKEKEMLSTLLGEQPATQDDTNQEERSKRRAISFGRAGTATTEGGASEGKIARTERRCGSRQPFSVRSGYVHSSGTRPFLDTFANSSRATASSTTTSSG